MHTYVPLFAKKEDRADNLGAWVYIGEERVGFFSNIEVAQIFVEMWNAKEAAKWEITENLNALNRAPIR